MIRSCLFVLGTAAIVAACADGTSVTDAPVDPGTVATDTDASADTGAAAHPSPDSGGGTPGFDAATVDSAAPPDAAPVNLACGKTFDFESSDGAFTHVPLDGASGATFDAWTYGAAAGALGCHSSTNCFATSLTGPYAQCQRAELRSPVIDLASCAAAGSVQVTFWHAYDFLGYTDAGGTTYYDGGIVELSGDGGATWTTAITSPPSVGNVSIAASRGFLGQYVCPGPSSFHVDAKSGFINKSTGWEAFEADVPVALRTNQFMVRFAYSTGKSTADNALAAAKPGWHIDDVAIVAK